MWARRSGPRSQKVMQATGVNTFTCSLPEHFWKTAQMVRASFATARHQRGPSRVTPRRACAAHVAVEYQGVSGICVDCRLTLLPATVVELRRSLYSTPCRRGL